jgi:hypothetical protein
VLAYSTLKPGVKKVIQQSADQMGAAADKFKPLP